jgi:hypothetical protein
MPQLFHPSMNVIARATIFGGVLIAGGLVWAGSLFLRSPWVNEVDVVREQPVPFSHNHHVEGLGIDCRYCHASVEKSPFAGMPATEVCMGCHSQIWDESPLLAPVRNSYRSDQPLAWTRVYDLPDFVYFNHSIHVSKGIGCESCHGRVDQMPLMRKATPLQMQWCLDCHRHPGDAVRDKDDVFRFGLPKPAGTSREPEKPRQITPNAPDVDPKNLGGGQLTNCVVCHR